MTQITKEQIQLLKYHQINCEGTDEWRTPELYDALAALIAIGERIASGEYVVVPMVPTQEMLKAGNDEADEALDRGTDSSPTCWYSGDVALHAYRAMLAAAKEQA